MKKVRIKCSPVSPDLEVVEDIVLKLHVPYSEKDVTIQINPNIQEYRENADQQGMNIRQVTITTPTDETQTLKFDFGEMKIQEVAISNDVYRIELLEIGKEEIKGQKFSYFDFSVSRKNK